MTQAVFLVVQEAEAGGLIVQDLPGLQNELKTRLGNLMRLYMKFKKKKNWALMLSVVVHAFKTQLLGGRGRWISVRSRSAWSTK